MTYEEALIDLQSIYKGHGGLYTDDSSVWELAFDALEKQIPKKLNSVFCPNCGRLTLIDGAFLDRFNYCLHCGQKIDWSGL